MKTPDRIFLHKDKKKFIADMMWATGKADEWFVDEYISVDAIRENYKEFIKNYESYGYPGELFDDSFVAFFNQLNIDLNNEE